MLLGHKILVFDRYHRNVQAYHRARLARVVACCGNYVFTGDVAAFGLDEPGT